MITRDSLPRSAAMLQAVEQLRQALTRGGGVLLCGEPGVGRLQFARAIHLAPVRPDGMPVETLLDRAMRNFQSSDRPWIEFDCGSPNGVERELFGCDPNYSAAHGLDRITAASALQFAFGGTLLLKQVSELPGRIQTRLARVFRDGEIVVEHADGTELVARVVVRPIATLDANGEDRRAARLRGKLTEPIRHAPTPRT